MSAAAHASFNCSRSVKPVWTWGSPVTPHLRRKAELDAIALFWANNSAIAGTTAEVSRTRKHFPPKFSNFWTKRSVEGLPSDRGMRSTGAERGDTSKSGGWPAALFRAFRISPRICSREVMGNLCAAHACLTTIDENSAWPAQAAYAG